MIQSCGSIFTGVGGADLGFEAAGFTPRWQIENDPARIKVLRSNWRGVTEHV